MINQICPTAKLEKLLLATDGSVYSEGAIREALNLSKQCSNRLIALSIVKTNLEFEMTMPQVVEKEEKKAREHLEAIKDKASKQGIDCEIMVSHGEEPYQEIVREASEGRVDLIIMGRHGRTGLLRLMMGSVTAGVIGHAPCNVLVMPPDAKVECKNILIATDGSRFSEAAAREAIYVAKQCKSSLIAISVASSDTEIATARENVKKVMDSAAKEGVKVDVIASTGKPSEVIVQIAMQKLVDLIVLGSHGRTGLKRLLMGSVTERVIGNSETAVLVVKAK